MEEIGTSYSPMPGFQEQCSTGCMIACAIVVVILLCVLFCTSPEHLDGNHIYTAGATMRVIGSQFTGTNQGSNDVVYDEATDWSNYNKTIEHLKVKGPGTSSKPSILKKKRS